MCSLISVVAVIFVHLGGRGVDLGEHMVVMLAIGLIQLLKIQNPADLRFLIVSNSVEF